jgi:predicted nucleotidyltransferase
MQMQRLYEKVLDELRDRLVSELGGKVEAIVVYGSVARREADADSDIDILIISRHRRAIYDQAARIRSELDLKYETMTTLTYLTPEEIDEGLAKGEPFVQEVFREGRALYGEAKFRGYRRAVQSCSNLPLTAVHLDSLQLAECLLRMQRI